jgi:uncharacterized protein with FMN-binding domain
MEPFEPDNKSRQVIATLAVLLVVVLVVIGVKAFDPKNKTSGDAATQQTSSNMSTANSTSETPPANTDSSSTATSQAYKDGTYSASGMYHSPGGTQSIGVRVTIQNDIVTDSNVVDQASDGDSQSYQMDFISGYKRYVIGKSVNGIHLSQVSGSSLTSLGFNNALEQIKQKAQI